MTAETHTAATTDTDKPDLAALLDVEQLERDIFRGGTANLSRRAVFGGQVAGQALMAAGHTVEEDRVVHSLHSYFIRAGEPTVPIVYQVERARDGRSFSVRRVSAIQHGRPIFVMSASFQLAQDGVDHELPMPEVPDPETLPTLAQRYTGRDAAVVILRPLDIRHIDAPPWEGHDGAVAGAGPHRLWVRTTPLRDEPILHASAMAYASDMNLLEPLLIRHGITGGAPGVKLASLDHAMWFHRPFRADEWLLYETESPSAAGGRGLATGRFFSTDGHLVASVAQEGMVRVSAD